MGGRTALSFLIPLDCSIRSSAWESGSGGKRKQWKSDLWEYLTVLHLRYYANLIINGIIIGYYHLVGTAASLLLHFVWYLCLCLWCLLVKQLTDSVFACMCVAVCVLTGKIKELKWKLRRFLGTSGCLVELPLVSPQEECWQGCTHSHGFLHGCTSEALSKEGCTVLPSWDSIIQASTHPTPHHPFCEPRHEAANTTHRQALPSCNHRWHTWSSFPDQFSCPSSCEWRKQHRKNNTSCRPSWGNVALTNHATQIKS